MLLSDVSPSNTLNRPSSTVSGEPAVGSLPLLEVPSFDQ